MYANLKFQLWRSGVRQNYLARLLGVDETTLSRIVNGFRQPAPELQAKIAAVLHSDQEWLFEKSGEASGQLISERIQPGYMKKPGDVEPGGSKD